MKKGLFSGWRDVFQFTFKQSTSRKFKRATIGLCIFFLLAGVAISVIMAIVQKNDANKLIDIEQVYVVDDSELSVLYLDGFEEMAKDTFPKLSLVTSDKDVSTLSEELKQNLYDIILHITHSEDSYLLTAVLPEGTAISQDDATALCDALQTNMQQSLLLSSGIAAEKLMVAMSGVATEELDAGEQGKSMGEEMVAMLLPMFSILLLFLLIQSYGMSIANTVSVEKSSKLMEMMLTMTKPYALVLGKVLAVVTTAIIQIIAWIGTLIGGFFLGHYIAGSFIYTDYHNLLLEIFKLMGEAEGSAAFSLEAGILALVCFLLGFLFFSMIASWLASFASKTEELSQTMSYYVIIAIIGFYAAYMIPLKEDPFLNSLLRVIPLTGAYKLPADILVGNVNIIYGLLETLLIFATTLVLAYFAGRAYKNEVFYKGKSLAERFKRKSRNVKSM